MPSEKAEKSGLLLFCDEDHKNSQNKRLPQEPLQFFAENRPLVLSDSAL